MKLKNIFKIISVFFLFCAFIVSAATFEFAPLNPEFLKYSSSGNSGIEIPSPVLLPPAVYPSAPGSFDLRSYKRVSPVKDQGTAGSCWAFATYASLESYLLPQQNFDFSENHMKNILSSSYSEGFDRKAYEGGNHYMSTAYLVRWSGPVLESEDPYNANSSSSPENLQSARHVQEVLFIPDRKNATDNNAIKQAVMNYGAIYTSMYYNNSYLAKGKNYYYSGSSFSNHAVAIVGWDDNYSRTNFYGSAAGIPPGDGAFIVKNSWGTLWGESGYFYISYYDSNIGKDCAVFNNAEPVNNYNQIYQYDPLGWVTSAGFGSDTAYFANIFNSTHQGIIQAVGFYTPVVESQYEVKIYKSVSGSSPVDGSLATAKTGVISDPGYHTIKLLSDVPVSKDEKFSAVVKLKTPGFNYPIPMEIQITGYSSKANALPGQSYVSKDGIVWTDVTSSSPNSNVCIKVYGSTLELDLISPDGGEEWEKTSTKTIAWHYAGNLKGNVKLELLKNDKLNYVISSGVPVGTNGSGTYLWKIPSNLQSSNDYKIRITSTTNPSITDTSNSTFSIIAGKIVVESPSTNAIFCKGTNQLIQWKSYGNVGNYVKIELLKSGNLMSTISSMVMTDTKGSFVWRIPLDIKPGNDYSIKISSITNPEIYGLTENFSIEGPTIKLVSPGTGETWYTGTGQTISWKYSGIYAADVKIECIRGNNSYKIAQTRLNNETGSFIWYIPATWIPSNDYKIRITGLNDSSIADISGEFTISKGSISLISPSGGEEWKTGETKNIVWSFAGNPGSTVRIELFRGSSFVGVIGTKSIGYGGTGSFIWKIPSTLTPASDYWIKLAVITNPDINTKGDYFSIVKNTENKGMFFNKNRFEQMQDYEYNK